MRLVSRGLTGAIRLGGGHMEFRIRKPFVFSPRFRPDYADSKATKGVGHVYRFDTAQNRTGTKGRSPLHNVPNVPLPASLRSDRALRRVVSWLCEVEETSEGRPFECPLRPFAHCCTTVLCCT